jgi:hypothetical protein
VTIIPKESITSYVPTSSHSSRHDGPFWSADGLANRAGLYRSDCRPRRVAGARWKTSFLASVLLS